MAEKLDYLERDVEHDILVLTITRRQLEGDEVAQGLKEELLRAVAESGLYRVVLDLKNTRYVSSIAFWPLLHLRRHLGEHGGKLLLCGLTGAVHDVFTSTKMVTSSGAVNAPFETAVDRGAAVAHMAGLAPPP